MRQETDIRSYKPGENIFSLLKPTQLIFEETRGLRRGDVFLKLKHPQPHTLKIKNRTRGILYSTPDYPTIQIETHATSCHIMHVDTDGGYLTTHNAGIVDEWLKEIKRASSKIGSISHLIIAGLCTVEDPSRTIEYIQLIFKNIPIHFIPNTSGLIIIPKELSRSNKKTILSIKDTDRDISTSEIRSPLRS
jgi:hypothetical protein